MSDRLVLLLAALGLVPIAMSYGLMPAQSLSYLLGIPVESVNHTHVFRAVMGLYLANAALWFAGYFNPSLRVAALWSLLIFMGGLAAGRVLSVIVDGVPGPLLVFYLVAELTLAALALRCLRRPG